MGFIARRLIKQNLELVDVLIEDTTNEYFNVIELPTTFTQGRSAFKIFGSRFLKRGVPLKMEIIDSAGSTVYITPVDLVGEEVPPYLPYRFVTVEVYRPPVNHEGLGRLTILGELDPNEVDFNIPTQFQGTYNVKYSTTINIDLSTFINTQPIRFYKNPTIEPTEIVKARIVDTPVVTTTRIFASSSAEPRPDIKDVAIPVVTGSQEKADGLPQAPKNTPSYKVESIKEDFKVKSGIHAGMPPIIARRGMRKIFASEEPPAFKITIPDGGLKSQMQGGTVTIPEHKKYVKTENSEGSSSIKEVTVPEFETKVLKVLDEKTFVPEDIPFIPDPEEINKGQQTSSLENNKIVGDPELPTPVIVDYWDSPVNDTNDELSVVVPVSMSFEDVETTIISSSVHFDSFMNLKIKNMRTFSGDVFRIKAHGKMQSKNDGFAVLGESVIESPELLRDTTSPSGFQRVGYFYTQSLIDTYWSGSSFDGSTKSNSIALTHTGSEYIDSMRISGSNYGANQTLVVEQKTGYEFRVDRSVPYTLIATIAGQTTNKEQTDGKVKKEGRLYFHLTGSNLNNSKQLPTNANVGGELTDRDTNRVVVLKLNPNLEGVQKLGTIEYTFPPRLNLDRLFNTDTRFQIRADSGLWHISDISLRPAMDTGFSPDEYEITVPLPRTTRPDKLDTFIEFFDINNGTTETLASEKNIVVSGSAFVIDGDDNLITGSLYMGNVAGAGIEMAGANSAYMRSVGYKGFISASEHSQGGFMIFSGSVLPDEVDNYTGAGLEIHDGNSSDSQSFFKFRTSPSQFDVRSRTFFLGNRHSPANFVSGSEGNLEISSSGFIVTSDGNVTASNFLFNSGVVSEDVDILGTVSANSILVPTMTGITVTAANASASISSQGFAAFRSASIGGWNVTPEYIFKPISGNLAHQDITRVYMSSVNDNVKNITEGFSVYRKDEDIANKSVKVVRVGGLSDTTNLHANNDYGLQVIQKDSNNNYSNILYIGSGSQEISGFSINPIAIHSSDKSLVLSGSGEITGSDVLFTGGKIGGWTIDDSKITSEGLEIHSRGDISSTNYQSNLAGFMLSSRLNGFLEVENAKIRGTLRTTVFEKETVNAVGGQLYVANSTTITGSTYFGTYVTSMSATDTTMSVANSSGFVGNYNTTGGEIISAKKVSATGFSTEYMYVQSASRIDASSDTDMRGFLYVVRGYSGSKEVAGTVSSSLGDIASSKQSYPEGQVIISTGRYISGTAAAGNIIGTGYIRLNANPSDHTTPYIDIVERTGSNIYDVDLKARLGDLTGLNRTNLHGTDPAEAGFGLYSQNVFLEGKIVATSGSIAGIQMTDGTLFSGTGTHGNSNTPFLLSSSGDFSLGDKFVWDEDAESLSMVGSISITGGDAQAQIAGIGAGAAASASNASATASLVGSGAVTSASNAAASGAAYGAGAVSSGSLYAQGIGAGSAASSSAQSQSISSFASAGKLVSAQVVVDTNGMSLYRAAGTDDDDLIASYGTTAKIRGNYSEADQVLVSSAGVQVIEGSAMVGQFGSTQFLGDTGSEHVRISGSGLEFKDGGTQRLAMNSSGLSIGNNIILDSSGDATFSGDLSAAGGSFSGTVTVLGDAIAGAGTSASNAAAGATGIGAGSVASASAQSASISSFASAGKLVSAQVVVSSAGMELRNSSGTTLADYGVNTTLTGGSITLRSSANNDDKFVLTADSAKFHDNGNEVGSFGATTTLGDTDTEHVEITSTGLKIKDGTVERVVMDSSGLSIGSGSFKADSSGNVSVGGRLDASAHFLPITRKNMLIDNSANQTDNDVKDTWSTSGFNVTLSEFNEGELRATMGANDTSPQNDFRWFYNFGKNVHGITSNDKEIFKISGKVYASLYQGPGSPFDMDLLIRYGKKDLTSITTAYSTTVTTTSNMTTTASFELMVPNFTGADVPGTLLILTADDTTITSGDTFTFKDMKCVATNNTGSGKNKTFGTIGGFNYDGNSLFSGTKVSASDFAAAGDLTIGADGYLSAEKFFIDTGGQANFKGKLLTDSQVETSAGHFDRFSGTVGSFIDEIGETVGTPGATCVLPGTKVLTKRGEINIEDSKKDDLIRVYDWKEKEWDWSPINKILNRVTKEGWSHIKTEKGYELKCSNSHLLYHPEYLGHAIKTNELGVGGQLYVIEDDKIVEDYIESIEVHNEPVEVWNYELEYTHNYISNGILSHNALPKLAFTGTHKYFVTASTDITSGDTVKLDDNNFLVKTTSAKDSSCVGIAAKLSEEIVQSGSFSDSMFKTNTVLSRSLQLDSFGTIKNDNDYNIMFVAALGDSRDFSSYLSGSGDDYSNYTLVTSSFQEVIGFKICNQGGLVSKGDLLCTSDTAGYLMKQPSEYVVTSFSGSNPVYEERQNMNSFTVGKLIESCSFDSNGKVEGVYGYLYCG